MTSEKGLTAREIGERLGVTEYTVQRAVDQMNIKGERPRHDRRRVEYPEGTLEKVNEWLENNK